MTLKRAPGRVEEQPDVFFSLSGGVDCVSALLIAKDAFETVEAGGNFAKKPVAIYLDTGTGTPLNRFYVEELCDQFDIQLWTLRTDEDFTEWLRRDGAPGAGAHGHIRNELKDRQASKLITISSPPKPLMVLGIAADESDTRAGFSKIREMRRHFEIYPAHRLTRKQRVEIILLEEACPINPLWLEPRAIRDCACGCHGDPSEYDKTKELFPNFGQRIDEWHEAITHDGLKGTLGWSGLTTNEKSAIKQGQVQSTLTTCDLDGGCRAERDPAEVRAWKAVANGKSREEAVSILHGPITSVGAVA